MDLKGNFAAFLVQKLDSESHSEINTMATQHYHQQHSGRDDKRKSQEVEPVHQDCHEIVEMETILVEDLIKPVAFLLKYTLPFYHTVKYDAGTRCCVVVKGHIFRMIFCIAWQILALYRLVIKLIPNSNYEISAQSESETLSTIATGAYVIFITFTLTTYYIFWMKVSQICDIFNSVIVLSEKLHLKHRSPGRIKLVRCAVHSSWLFVSFYVGITIVLYMIEVFCPYMIRVNSSGQLNQLPVANMSSNLVHLPRLDFTNVHATDDLMIIQILTAVASFVSIFTWMMTFLNLGAWALFFRQLITLFYWKIRTKDELGQFVLIPHEIRTFNKIGTILENFNGIYGVQNLLGAVVVVTYMSTTVKHAFSGLDNILQMSAGWHLLLSYTPMAVTSLALAEVPRMAGVFAAIIKNEFFGKFTKECGDAAESLCGIAIVHYDLTTSNIGFKGLGFFTVSYQFITTIVSVIITYSILVVQLFPQDNAIEV